MSMSASCERAIDHMHAALDGTLQDVDRVTLDAHTERCASCRELREQLLAVVVTARHLPREIPPSRDLWPEIRAALRPQHRQGNVRWLRASVAIALLAASALFLSKMPDWSAPATVTDHPIAAQALDEARSLERGIAELEVALAARSKDMDQETLIIVRRNLAIIDAAIEETMAALEESTGERDEIGQAALAALQQHKIQLLRQATALVQPG